MSNTTVGAPAYLWPVSDVDGRAYISPPPQEGFAGAAFRYVAILGSTGSIGRNALAVAEADANVRVCALAAGDNVELLAEQAIRWRPQWLAVRNEELAANLRRLLPKGLAPKIVWGASGYASLAALPEVGCVLSAQAGMAGLTATLTAALAGKVIALANKESLVAVGGLLRRICKRTGASILPVDSEHFALFQCLAGRNLADVRHLILTASGGPFLRKSREDMARATPEQALNHPNWRMGAKISIDSATMMNKGLELIEAVQLFGVTPDQVKVVIQPQSVIHSLVEFKDNSMLAQLAVADMRLPIAGSLLWPQQMVSAVAPLSLAKVGRLDFLEPDLDKFPCLSLARNAIGHEPTEAWRQTGLNPACLALNCANETAVNMFLRGKCALTDIPLLVDAAVRKVIEDVDGLPPPAMPEQDNPVRQGMALAAMIAQFTSRIRAWVEAVDSPADVAAL